MPKVQVGLRAVVGDKDLSVLDGVHGSRIHIDIGIKLLHGDGIPARLQKPAQRCCCDTLSEAGHDPAGYKYIFYCHGFLPYV